jgi:hypothetical protein
MPQFRKLVAIKMQSRVALLDSAETGVETPGKGGINKPHHASDDQIRSPLTRQRQTNNPPSVATRSQSQLCYAVIASTSAIHFHHRLKEYQINGGK